MVDKAVGTAGTLRITDDGTTVRFYVLCSDPATNVGAYRFAVNGTWATTTLPSGFGSKLLATRTYSSTTSVTLQQDPTGTLGLGGANSLTTTITRSSANAPSGLTVIRVSDTQHTLNWSRNSVYTSVVVQRRTDGGAWQQVGVASGNAFTFTDRSTVADHKYDYRVAGRTSGGTSGWSGTATVYTTPAPPTYLVATRSGSDILLDTRFVEDQTAYVDHYQVFDNGVLIADNVSEFLPWTHVAPDPLVAHTYTMKAVKSGLVGPMSGPSNTVSFIAPPNAPTGLTPNGAASASDVDVVFGWVHNPVDTSAQSAFELQYRVPGGEWTSVEGTTGSTVAIGLDVGTVEWQVRTKGAHPDWSGWSATALVSIIDRPGVAITHPDDVWESSELTVEWSWLQAQGRPQSSWQLEMAREGHVLMTRAGTGAATSAVLPQRLTEGEWLVRVRAATGDVWSVWAEQPVTVSFIPPAEPIITGDWDESQGGVNLQVTGEVFGSAVLDDGAWYADVDFN